MRIGILSLNFSWHGEATAAATWTENLKACGYDAELFTFSKSGKLLNRFRTDYPVTVLKSKDAEQCAIFFDSKDIIVSFGTGVPGEDEFETPAYLAPLTFMNTPLVVYLPIQADLLFNAYKHSDSFMSLPTIVGLMLPRPSLVKRCYTEGPFVGYFRGLPYQVIEHPFDMTGVVPKRCEGKKFVCTTRIAPSKKIKQLLAAVKAFDLTKSVDIEIWGNKGESRYGHFLEAEFGDLFLSLYKGSYTHKEINSVYAGSRFCFDLTDFAHDGGTGQNTYRESMRLSVVPIVLSQWNVADSCFPTPDLSPAWLSDTIIRASLMDEDGRLKLIERGHKFLRKTHDPRTQTTKLISWLTQLIS